MSVKKHFLCLNSFLIFIILSCDDNNVDQGMNGNNNNNNQQTVENWEQLEIEDLSDSLLAANTLYKSFIDRPSMEIGYMELNISDDDERNIPEIDQVYYIFEGKGVMAIGLDTLEINSGNILFAGQGKSGKVISITELLKIVFIYRKAIPATAPVNNFKFDASQLAVASISNQNIWNPFISRNNLILGMYSLPLQNGGDNRLVHTFEELNIVVNGSSIFSMDTDNVEIKPGTIVFVNNGLGHSFKSLDGDLDVLIFWEQP